MHRLPMRFTTPSIEILADKDPPQISPAGHIGEQRRHAVSDSAHSLKPFEWDDMMNTNAARVFYTMRTFVPIMVQTAVDTSSTSHRSLERTPFRCCMLRRQ